MTLDSATKSRIFQAALQLFARNGSTSIAISDLAKQAGVARGTIYSHIVSIETLFEDVATYLTDEMTKIIHERLKPIDDPQKRLALGVSLYLKRAHEEPDWALFLIRFGFSHGTIKVLWEGPAIQDLTRGIQSGLYTIREAQIPTSVTYFACSVMGSMYLIREGIRTWREAALDNIELILRSLGLAPDAARAAAQDAMKSFDSL